MKKLLLSLLLAGAGTPAANAQVTLEHTYTNCYGVNYVILEDEGGKYVTFDTLADKVMFYNTNHSLWKSFSVPHQARKWPGISCASTKLFNADSKVEIAYYYASTTPAPNPKTTYVTNIISEDGTILNTFNDVYAFFPLNVEGKWKIRGLHPQGYSTSIYAAPGSMPQQNTGLKPDAAAGAGTSFYPNPMADAATLAYELPAGVHEATVSITNTAGQVLRTYTVTSQFSTLLIPRHELPAGHYVYKVAAQGMQPVANSFIIQ